MDTGTVVIRLGKVEEQSVPVPHSSIWPYLVILRDKVTLFIWAYFGISKYDFHLSLFRCVRQERISIRGSVRPSVRRSVGWSVRYACAKTVFLGCFWPRWDPTLKQMINQHVLRVFSPVCSSICLSIHMSHDQYTLRHSPDASLPGRACFHIHRYQEENGWSVMFWFSIAWLKSSF